MKANIYKKVLAVLVAFLAVNSSFSQDISISVNTGKSAQVLVKAKINTKAVIAKAEAFSNDLELNLNNLGSNLSDKLNELIPKIASDIKADVNVNGYNYSYSGDNLAERDDVGVIKEKFKSYSKTYPIDGNDQIKLSNQYGRMVVNTWERHEVKVDVQVKAQADNDDDAQKLLDGVHINDSKDGNVVSFRTQIERNNGGWKLWNFGGSKKHKVEINYTVYMPARTDLNVEASYGSIQLPDLAGKVKISSSYGSVSAQTLSNPANEISGSYGSLKAASINGSHMDFSYGSVDIEQCNNIKADLSYGSFKLGKLTGVGELDLSYVGGFKIDELADSFKKLKIDASYSSVAVGVAGNDNFDFDITTSYGGFDYNDNKVTITSKTPADGSRHIGPTRNYKGHFGKGSADALINIHTSYGGVNFE